MRAIDKVSQDDDDAADAKYRQLLGNLEDALVPFLQELHKWEYLSPYLDLPSQLPTEPRPVTTVSFPYTVTSRDGSTRSVTLSFDKEIDRLASFAPEFLEDHDADDEDEDAIAAVKDAIRTAFKEKRALEERKFAEITERMASYSEEELAALRSIRKVKYYPNHPTIDVSAHVNDVVSLALGKADEVVPPVKDYVFPEPAVADEPPAAKAPSTARRARPTSRLTEDEAGGRKRARSVGRKRTPKKLRR
mmetsp:Transcript_11352/g.36074  ORF Transcript_11352/g.36074 Transcript_11352/m.36074 type:complete len:248 (+) Transcript_11352:1-744(+)